MALKQYPYPVLSYRPVDPNRARFEADAKMLPALDPGYGEPKPFTRGEIALTPGQKIALLKMRRSDWSKAVLKHLTAFGQADCSGNDYRSLAAIGLASNKGSFHILTQAGRWKADQVAGELARAAGMHVITYDFGSAGRAAYSCCTCGWRAYRSRAIPSYVIALGRDARHHLQHVGAATTAEIAVMRYLGMHCGVGGQVSIPFRLREAAARTERLGLVQMWFLHEIGVGLSNPFYGLTVRGRQLAAALLCARSPSRRSRPTDANHGADDVSTR